MSYKISIITPTLNSEKYIENNLKSVHLDQYHSLYIEQIIVDGMSTDNTIEIVEHFRHKNGANIKILVGKDTNMYDAINKALNSGVGEIWACLNSDDSYYPQILQNILSEFINRPDLDVVYCPLDFYNELGQYLYTQYFPPFDLDYLIRSKICSNISQPSTFLRKRVLEKVGFFDARYQYASDYDYLIRVGHVCKLKYSQFHTTKFCNRASSISRDEKTFSIQLHDSKKISDYYMKEYSISQKNTLIKDYQYMLYQLKPHNFNYFLRRFPSYSISKIKYY